MKRLSSLTLVPLLLSFIATATFGQQTAIQTQPSSDGNLELALTEVKQKNDVITIKALLKNISGGNQKVVLCYQDVYSIDPIEKKKYMSLKDAQDASIAGPVDNAYYCKSGRLDRELGPGQQAMLWIKFPAFGSNASEADFILPNFLPFEGVPIIK